MSQRIPVLTDADLLRIVKRDFLACEHAEAISVLSGYSYDESLRVKIACLKIANGSLDELKHAVDNAMIDMRDILAYAEYPRAMTEYSNTDTQTTKDSESINREDWAQYQAWLNK